MTRSSLSSKEVGGVEFRKSIFILIGNAGTEAITGYAFDYLKKRDARRENIPTNELEFVVRSAIEDTKRGLGNWKLTRDSPIDLIVPFLPLEREHIDNCIRVAVMKLGIAPTIQLVQGVPIANTDQHFYPHGCGDVTRQTHIYLSLRNK